MNAKDIWAPAKRLHELNCLISLYMISAIVHVIVHDSRSGKLEANFRSTYSQIQIRFTAFDKWNQPPQFLIQIFHRATEVRVQR